MERSRVASFIALPFMTLTQFMNAIQPDYDSGWSGRASNGYIPNRGYETPVLRHEDISGWAADPIALLALPALAALFFFNMNSGSGWMRFRYRIAGAVLVVCLIPVNVGDDRQWGNGEAVGVFTTVIAVIAALMRKKAARRCAIRSKRRRGSCAWRYFHRPRPGASADHSARQHRAVPSRLSAISVHFRPV